MTMTNTKDDQASTQKYLHRRGSIPPPVRGSRGSMASAESIDQQNSEEGSKNDMDELDQEVYSPAGSGQVNSFVPSANVSLRSEASVEPSSLDPDAPTQAMARAADNCLSTYGTSSIGGPSFKEMSRAFMDQPRQSVIEEDDYAEHERVNDYEDFEEEEIVKESVMDPLLKKENAKVTRDNENFGKHVTLYVIAQPLLFLPLLAAILVAVVSPLVNAHLYHMVDQIRAGSINSHFANVEMVVGNFSQNQVDLNADFEILHGGNTLELQRKAGSTIELLDSNVAIARFRQLADEEWTVNGLEADTDNTGKNNITIPLTFLDQTKPEDQVESDVARPFWYLLFNSRQTRNWNVASVINYKLNMRDGTEVIVDGEYHLTNLPIQGFGDMSGDLEISSLTLDGEDKITLAGHITGSTRSSTRVTINSNAPLALCYSDTVVGMRPGVVVYDGNRKVVREDTLETCVSVTMSDGFAMSQSSTERHPITVSDLSISSRILGCLLSPITDVADSCNLELRPIPGNKSKPSILEDMFAVPIHRATTSLAFETEQPVISIAAGTQALGRFGDISSADIRIKSTLKSIETVSNRDIQRLSIQPFLSTIDPMYGSFRFSVTAEDGSATRTCYPFTDGGNQPDQFAALHHQLSSHVLPAGSVQYTPTPIDGDSCSRMLYPAMCCLAKHLGRSSIILDILIGMKFDGIDQELATEQPSMRVVCDMEDFDANSACDLIDFIDQ
eukprot:Clim_evm156s210 gene=Clim_evmTU156s210